MEKKISVIVPVYNTEEYLEKCVDSILGQTYRNLEVILVDDGSTDGSPGICDRYGKEDGRVRVIHKENGGNTSARKAGLAAAAGEYIGFVDSDDWTEPDMYETLHGIFTENDLDIISCGFFRETEEGTETVSDYLEEGLHVLHDYDGFLQSIMKGNPKNSENVYSYLWSKLIRRDIIIHNQKKIDDRIVLIEDRALLYTCYYDTRRFYILKKPLYHYRVRKNSMVNKVDDYIVSKLNDVYAYQKKLFLANHASRELLRLNEHFFIGHLVGVLKNNMGLEGRFLSHPLPWEARGRKVIIYGAADLGREYYSQLGTFCSTGWLTDTRWEKIGDPAVIPPGEALAREYDVIVIAAWKKETADEIRDMLKDHGVEETKIVWRVQVGGELIYV